MSSSEVKNLRAICEAMDQHAHKCGAPLVAVVMNPFEVDRLAWDEGQEVAV